MKKKIKKQIIPIDESARILIEPNNYILQFRRNSKTLLTWCTKGHFPDLTSLYLYCLNSYPQRSENAISSIEELIQVIKKAEARICKIINKN